MLDEIFKYNSKTWALLADKVLNGDIILFVGAGISHGSGFPDWQELIRALCKKVNIEFEQTEFVKSGAAYLQVCASNIEKKLSNANNERGLASAIRSIIRNSDEKRDFSIQKRLIKLLFPRGGVIATTNYDDFLEIAADPIVGHITHSYPYKEDKEKQVQLSSILDLKNATHQQSIAEKLHIFKLHGDIWSESIVLSEDSYRTAYLNPYTRGILDTLYNQDILFLGCSLSDPFFLSDWRKNQTTGEWFVLYPTSADSNTIDKALLSEEKGTKNPINEQISSLNIRSIYYTIEDMKNASQHSKCISLFLEELEQQKALKECKRIKRASDLDDAENDDSVIALEFCSWERGEAYSIDNLGARYKKLQKRIKRVVFAEGYFAEDIPEKAFSRFEQLVEVQLNTSIRRIRARAFYGCSFLRYIYTSNGNGHGNVYFNRLEQIDYIGECAFSLCNSLEKFDLTQSTQLKEIPTRTFDGCEQLREVYFPSVLESLGAKSFYGCVNLETINWQDLKLLRTIAQQAFTNCHNLKMIFLPESLVSLGEGAFQNVKNAMLGGLDACKLIEIPEYAFQNCDGITVALFPDTVRTISFHAMAECDKLKQVFIPKSVKRICANAFTKCKKLESVQFLSDNKVIIDDNAFSQCSTVYQDEIDREVAIHRLLE